MREFSEVMSILKFTIGNANGPAGPRLNCSILSVDLKAAAMSHPKLVLKESLFAFSQLDLCYCT